MPRSTLHTSSDSFECVLICPSILVDVGQGLAIGNGLSNPNIRYEAYADYALKMGLIADDDHKRLSKLFPACATSINLCGTHFFLIMNSNSSDLMQL